MSLQDDRYWMQQALELAKQAAASGEVPVGAIIVRNNEVIGQGYNCPITTHDPSAHAEMVALRSAAQFIKNYRLVDTIMYVTLEPCPMCMGAMLHSRIDRLVYGAIDEKGGAVESVIAMLNYKWNHKFTSCGGVLAEESAELLRSFFRARRIGDKEKL